MHGFDVILRYSVCSVSQMKVQTPSNIHKLYFVDIRSKASNYYIWNKYENELNQLNYNSMIVTNSELQMKSFDCDSWCCLLLGTRWDDPILLDIITDAVAYAE